MNKVLTFLFVAIMLFSCRGRGSGPLQTDDPEAQGTDPHGHTGAVTTDRIYITIDPCSDCVIISDLFKNKKNYSGKSINIKGIVTRFNPAIMDKNWVHLQDGSEYKDDFDLTVTTDEIVQVGDTVTFNGKISLEKDFGYGYYYPVLLEDAKQVK